MISQLFTVNALRDFLDAHDEEISLNRRPDEFRMDIAIKLNLGGLLGYEFKGQQYLLKFDNKDNLLIFWLKYGR